MGPEGKQRAEQLLADIDGEVLTDIPEGHDLRYIDVVAPVSPADILNALDGDDTTPGMMHHDGDTLRPGEPALVVRGIGEIAIARDNTDSTVDPDDEELVLITFEDLAAKLPTSHQS